MALTPGTRLGPYEIVARIGAGGMGEVFKARDTRLDRAVAIKVMPAALSDDPALRERFDREARVISSLSHPHICPLFDVGEDQGTAFLVMELLDGETLEARLATAALPVDVALPLAIEILSALDAAHRAGVVHRDLKPGNVMLTKSGAKLLDFGLAKACAPTVSGSGGSMLPTTPPSLTSQGTILGTFQYMAPEQIEGLEADARTDLFAFGCVFYEMLTGRKAFEGKTRASLLGAIMHADPPPVSQILPVAPAPLNRIVAACLAKDPAERWQTARDLLRELKWVSEGMSSLDGTAGTASPVAPRPVWSRALTWASGAAAVLFAIAWLVGWAPWVRPRSASAADPPVGRFSIDVPSTQTIQPVGVVSPDGKAILLRHSNAAGPVFSLRPLDDAVLRLVPTANAAGLGNSSFWSPDSRSVAFFTTGGLQRWDVGATTVTTLARLPSTPFGYSGAWGDKTILVSSSLRGLLAVPVSGGELKPATRLNETLHEVSHRYPVFLPDGRHFLFTAYTELNPNSPSAVYWASLDGAPVRVGALSGRVAFVDGYVLYLTGRQLMAQAFDPARGRLGGDAIRLPVEVAGEWSASASVLVYSNTALLGKRFMWRGRDGQDLGAVGPPGTYPTFDLSPDGRRIVATTRTDQGQNLWVIDAERGATSRLTLSEFNDVDPRWSADGREVIFGSTRSNTRSPFRVKVADPQPTPVFEFDGRMLALDDWSPDGRFLLFHDTAVPTLFATPLDNPKARIVAARALTGTIDQAQMSPDGHRIAFNLNESGRSEVVIVPFPPTGDRWPVSRDGGMQPMWRADGRELYFLSPAGEMMAVDIGSSGGSVQIGTPRKLFDSGLGDPSSNTEQYAPAPDGQRFLIAAPVQTGIAPGVTVITNWQTLLKRARAEHP